MSQPKITLYVDIVSPFAYIAFYTLKNSKVFENVDVTYVPILLGGLMKVCENTPPLRIKNKDKWINTERQRLSAHFSVPISQATPPGFPINTLPIQRALVSLSVSHPQALEAAIALFYANFWAEWNEPTKPENMLSILTTVLGSEEEAKSVLERTKSEEVKKVLGSNTEMAFADGAFGLPWFVATNGKGVTQGYWGVDHISLMCDHLGIGRPDGRERALL